MTDKEFEALKKLASGSYLEINDATVVRLTATLPKKYQEFCDILSNEILILKKLINEKDKKYADLYKDLKLNHKRTMDSKSDFDAFINSDDSYYDILVKISKQEVIVSWLEATINNIKSCGFATKNYLDLQKFFSGA